MPRRQAKPESRRLRTTPFPRKGWASRAARLLVLEMVLWPGLLFAGSMLVAAYQLRAEPVVWPFLALATLLSIAVGVRQWSVMLRAVFPGSLQRPAAINQHPGEDSPRLTGRGTTER